MNKIEQLRQLLKHKKSREYYAKKLGVSVEEVAVLLHQIQGTKEEQQTFSTNTDKTFSENIETGKAELTEVISEPIKTLEELAERCKIDRNIWNITKYVQNFWGSTTNPSYQVKAWLSRKSIDTDLSWQKDFLLQEIKESKERVFPLSVEKAPSWLTNEDRVGDTLLEISIPDIHIGKLGWEQESGKDYDIDIAVKRYKEAVSELLSRVNLSSVERILLPLGNDAIHIDNSENTTTAGTAVDTDGRFPKIFRAAKKLFIETIEELKIIAPVDVVIVRGNHDSQTMFLMGEVLEAWFDGDDEVTIYNSPKLRKYYQYGQVGIQYTHGDKEKHADLGQIFAHEEPQLWADTKFRFCKLGHLHKNKITDRVSKDTFLGFQVEILPSLSGPDEWHYGKGFVVAPQAKAFLYHKTKGEIAAFTTTVND